MAVKKFIKFDSELGYLEDKDDINYFATSQMRRVAFGGMLGEFDENGLYVINKKIVEELIKMPKVVVEMVEDADLIRSTIKADTFFHFILTVEDNKASLKLLEKINYQSNRDFNSGSYSNINEYVLDEVIVPDKDFDRNALYEKYNISTENDGEALSIFDMDELSIALYYNLVQKLKANYLVQNELILKEKDIESIEADYFEDMLMALSGFGEFGQKVKNAVQDDLAEKHTFMIISKPFFQKSINEVLDAYIEQFIEDLPPEQKTEFLTKIREIKEKYYQKFKALIPIEISRKSGVRFDANQIVEESIIGTLAQEINTKGFTSSDVRRIVINDDELQLTIAKIKEIVKQNEEECNRNNANAKDITKGRKLTEEFYKELGTKKKTDLLTDKPLIKTAITENVASVDSAKKAEKVAGASSAPEVKKAAPKTAAKDSSKSAGKSAGKSGGKSAGGGGSSSGKGGKSDKADKAKTSAGGKGGTKQEGKNESKFILYGSYVSVGDKKNQGQNNSAGKQGQNKEGFDTKVSRLIGNQKALNVNKSKSIGYQGGKTENLNDLEL